MNDLFGDEMFVETKTLERLEREAIAAALVKHGSATAAAKHLRIGRATIHRKMRRYNLFSPKSHEVA